LTLQDEFTKLLSSDRNAKEHDSIFDELKTAVRDESMKKHKWDEKAEDSLV
jgi:optic atrophy protein 1